MKIAISYDKGMQEVAEQLVETTHFALYPSYLKTDNKQFPDFLLHVGASKLQLNLAKPSSLKPLYIDFIAGKSQHRRLYGGGKNQQLAKAIGLNKYKKPIVLDTTAGLGKDAFVLATLGCRVTLLERTLPLYLLLEDALSRAYASNDPAIPIILDNMLLKHKDSIDYLTTLKETQYPDVIYIDPMFPPRNKSAKVKKDMVILHHLLGHDNDAQQIIEQALPRARKRIVVKRPRLAECLYSKPAFQIIGKSTRYDVYLPTAS